MTTEISKTTKPVSDIVFAKVETLKQLGQLVLPSDYHAGNALKSAQLILNDLETKTGKPVLQACSKSSIQSALLSMVVQGFNPLKQHFAFIVRGGKLTLQPEYSGKMARAKREANLDYVKAYTVYDGDDIELEIDLETGLQKMVKCKMNPDNINKEKIKGAFAIGKFLDGKTDTLYMSISQIRDAWMQGDAKGNSPAHRNFPDQMAEKTVINRFLKRYINASNDVVEIKEIGENGMIHQNDTEEEIIDSAEAFQEVEVIEDEKTEASETVTHEAKVIKDVEPEKPNF